MKFSLAETNIMLSLSLSNLRSKHFFHGYINLYQTITIYFREPKLINHHLILFFQN